MLFPLTCIALQKHAAQMPSPSVEPKPKQLKYREVEEKLRKLICTLPVGARLPAERVLAQSFQCNFLTVRRALRPLVEEGVVVRKVGSGTFVAVHPVSITHPVMERPQIGVLILQSDDVYVYPVLQAISQAAAALGVELSSTWSLDFALDGLNRAKALATQGCTSVIVPWVPPDRMDEVRQFAAVCPVPLSLPLVIPGLEKFCFERQEIFGSHAIAATEAVVGYFRRRGNSRIAFLGPDTPADPILQKKLSAYACQTSRDKLPSLCGLVTKSAAAMDGLAEEWKTFRGDLAVVAYDDEHALRFITAMHKLGLSAPADFRIIGFNNTDAGRYSDPPLSTVCPNFDYIGRSSITSALALAEGTTWQSSEVPRTRLVLRATCGGARDDAQSFQSAMPELDFVFETQVSLSS